MPNDAFISNFANSYAVFQQYRISDHSPSILKIHQHVRVKPKTFKFSNFIVHKKEFEDIEKDEWKTEVSGHKMYCVVLKLRKMKKSLRKLMWLKGSLHERVMKLRNELEAQKALNANPHSLERSEEESHLFKAFNEALLDEERFLKQKSTVEWLRVGDCNSAIFIKL